MRSSPTGELFLTDVRMSRDQRIAETEDVAPAAASEPRHRYAQVNGSARAA